MTGRLKAAAGQAGTNRPMETSENFNARPLIVIDKGIPFVKGVFEPFADVIYASGAEIDREMVHNCDALLVRTRTRCDAALLESSRVSFVATATIGTDHIDVDWCTSNGIEVVSAPGCNSSAVRQYFFTALYALASRKCISLEGKTMGVIGVGHVGSKVADMAETLGFKVLRNDPPREAAGDGPRGYFTSLEELLRESDIVTMHIPLDVHNRDFADSVFFSLMKDGALFFNACRGECLDENALIENAARLGGIVIDVWKNEPVINRRLMDVADIATPHIAGYSRQGKINGTAAVVRAAANHFNFSSLKNFSLPSAIETMELCHLPQERVCSLLTERYDIYGDDASLRLHPEEFENLRLAYDYRIEF